ncbi:probable GTP diphosphokinase RSH2, chloroplastic, partial [Olea europaea subsp. europaea]
VSKLSDLSKLARDNNIASKTVEADRLNTTFLAMADARAVLIKLANRYHNMMTLDALPLIKIRTKEMHLQAEYGFAEIQGTEEGDCEHSSFVLQMVEWARWVVTWQCEAMSKDRSSIGFVDSMKLPCTSPTHSVDCPFSCKPHCGSDGIVFVIVIENDKMSVHEFPANSNVMVLLERAGQGSSIWTTYGFPVMEELRPQLNHEPVGDPTCKLKMEMRWN